MNQRGQLTTGCGVFRAPLNLDWAAAARMGSKDHVVVGLVLAMALVAAPGSRLLLLRSRSTQLMTPTGSDEGTTNMGRCSHRCPRLNRAALALGIVEGTRAPARRTRKRQPKTNIERRRQKHSWQAAGTACTQVGEPQGLLAGHLRRILRREAHLLSLLRRRFFCRLDERFRARGYVARRGTKHAHFSSWRHGLVGMRGVGKREEKQSRRAPALEARGIAKKAQSQHNARATAHCIVRPCATQSLRAFAA